nr:MAG TPA: nuclease [Caudoviricetes sp.]
MGREQLLNQIASGSGYTPQTSSTSPSRTSAVEDYYNEQMQKKQATEKARDVIDGRGRGLVGGLRDAWLDKNGEAKSTTVDSRGNNSALRKEYQRQNPNIPTMSTALSDDEKAQLQNAYTDAVRKYSDSSKKAKSIRPEEGLDYATTLEKYRSEQQAATEEKAAAESEMNELRKQLESRGIEIPVEASDYDQNVFERLWGAVKGGSKQAAGSLGGAAGYTGRVATGSQNAVDKALRDSGNEELSALYHVGTEEEDEKAMQMQQAIADKSAELSESGGRDIERSKWGASGAGKFALDAVSQVPALAADMAANAVLPGAGMAMMMGRSFGGGVQQAEAGGGNLAQAGAYGAASAAKEYLTEKMFGGLDLAYGKGFADTAVEKLVGKLAKTDIGRTVLRTIINGGGGEFVEEFVSSAVDPTLRAIYNGKSIGENYSEEQVSDWLYDGFVGAALGIAGSGVSIATGDDAKKNARLRSGEVDKAFELMTGKKAASEPQSAAEPQGDITTPPTPSNDAVARPVELNPAVSNNAETQNADVQKNTAPTGTESTAVNDNPATHTAEEMTRIEDYKASTDESLKEVVEEYYADPKKPFSRHNISSVTEKQATDIASVLGGGNYNGFKNAINSDGIKHILNEHGPNGSVNHSMGDLNDIARIGYVLDNYDDVRLATYPSGDQRFSEGFQNSDNSPAPMVVFTKKVNGTYYVVEAVPDTKYKKLWVVSAYLDKKGGVTQASDATSPEVTPKTSLASPPQSENIFSDNSIPTAQQNVNSGQAENSGSSEQRAKTNLGSKSTRAKTSQAVETLMEADITPEARQEQLNPYIKNGRFDYIPDTNKAQVRRATKKIAEVGWEQAVKDFHDNVTSGKSSKDLVAEGAILLNNAANSDASGRTYLDLANDFIEMAHRAGETLQAIKVLQQLSPSGRLYLMTKNVKAINESLTKGQRKAIAKKQEGSNYKKISAEDIYSNYEVKLDKDLAAEYMNAKTDEQRDAVLSKIQQNIADQIPSTFGEKWNAIRYVNMLGNFKTQIRNVGGNTLMMATQMTKNRVKAAAEAIDNLFRSEDKKIERTAAFRVGKQLRAEAAADFESIKDIARGEGKYNDNAKMAKEIQDKRRIFNSNLLEAYRKATNWAMDAGDVIFLKANYADALGGWLKAHGIKSMADATPEQLDRGRAYAIKEAQEATFRDDNVVSKAVNKIGRNPITEGIIPFRKTPANVAVRAVEYSPLGIAETIYKGIQTKSGNANANDVINSLSKNVVGSTLAFAGYALAKAGFARGSEDDDDLDSFQKMQGKQDYAVKIGDKWISLSQLAPNSVPLYMGVMLYEALDGGGLTWDSAYKILGCLNDPLMDMSMLSGVNDALSDVITYGDDGTMVWKVLGNAMMSYLTQGINNSLIGQAEQAWEENRQTVYSDKDSVLPSNVQYKLGKAMGKIPGVDYHQQDYVDAWGRTQSNGSAGKRIFDAFINPFYSGTDSTTKVDTELERLYEAGKDVDGFPNVLPQKASRSLEYSKGTSMTPDEYKQYSIDRGQKSLELVSDFMESDEYKIMSDIQRAEVISDLYSLAADRALKSVKTTNGIAYTGKLDDVAKLKDVPEYYASKEILSGAKGNTKENFDAIDQVLKNFGHLKDDTQAALRDSDGLYVDKLLYAKDKGIKSKDWFDIYTAVKDYKKQTDNGSDSAASIAVGNTVKGTDAEKLAALEAQLTPDGENAKNPGKRNATVRRYEAAIDSGISYDTWAKIEAALNEIAPGKTPNLNEINAAVAKSGTGVNASTVYKIYKDYSSDESKVKQYDYSYGSSESDSSETNNSKSSSPASRTMDDYYRALGLIK